MNDTNVIIRSLYATSLQHYFRFFRRILFSWVIAPREAALRWFSGGFDLLIRGLPWETLHQSPFKCLKSHCYSVQKEAFLAPNSTLTRSCFLVWNRAWHTQSLGRILGELDHKAQMKDSTTSDDQYINLYSLRNRKAASLQPLNLLDVRPVIIFI